MRHDFLIWLVFLIGQGIHLAVQVYTMVKDPNNPATSVAGMFRSRWPVFLSRVFLSSMLFWLWLDGQLIAALTASGVQVPATVNAILGLHISGGVAGLVGWGSDSVLAYIPGLKSSLPTP